MGFLWFFLGLVRLDVSPERIMPEIVPAGKAVSHAEVRSRFEGFKEPSKAPR
jgi:hypothetical protein